MALVASLSLTGIAKAQQPLTSVARDVPLGPGPISVVLSPEPALASALPESGGVPTVLAVQGIEGAAAQPIRINVFLNKSDVDNRTSTDDPSCLGFIQLLPAQGRVRRTGYNFDLSEMRNLDPAKPIRVTLVPVVGTDSMPSDVSLHIGQLYIRQEH